MLDLESLHMVNKYHNLLNRQLLHNQLKMAHGRLTLYNMHNTATDRGSAMLYSCPPISKKQAPLTTWSRTPVVYLQPSTMLQKSIPTRAGKNPERITPGVKNQ